MEAAASESVLRQIDETYQIPIIPTPTDQKMVHNVPDAEDSDDLPELKSPVQAYTPRHH